MGDGLFLRTVAEKFDDPRSETGVGDPSTHAAYLTDRTLPERSGEGIHFQYYQRWAIEESINEISNNLMTVLLGPETASLLANLDELLELLD